jgi:hypothetical protein
MLSYFYSNDYGFLLYGRKNFLEDDAISVEVGKQFSTYEKSVFTTFEEGFYTIVTIRTPIINNNKSYTGLFSFDYDFENESSTSFIGFSTNAFFWKSKNFTINHILGIKYDDETNKEGIYIETSFSKTF